LNPDTLAGARP